MHRLRRPGVWGEAGVPEGDWADGGNGSASDPDTGSAVAVVIGEPRVDVNGGAGATTAWRDFSLSRLRTKRG